MGFNRRKLEDRRRAAAEKAAAERAQGRRPAKFKVRVPADKHDDFTDDEIASILHGRAMFRRWLFPLSDDVLSYRNIRRAAFDRWQ